MTDALPTLLLYSAVFVLAAALYAGARSRGERRSASRQRDNAQKGLEEPVSLHPFIDPAVCIGCAACVTACPEKDVLGIIDGKAEIINPNHCIGHGACRTACPVGAIALVFGSKKRGVDIPFVKPNFETSVPGIYIAGELGGMGLIRNAVEQGRQAVESIAKAVRGLPKSPGIWPLAIVGAGPAGFAASLAARKAGLEALTLEQDTLGGAVARYPRGKLVMTQPLELFGYGRLRAGRVSKEELIRLWKEVEKKAGLSIRYRESVESIVRTPDGFELKTAAGAYRARAVLLAIGRRGTPRKLGVPGEESEKVAYGLEDPERCQGRAVLVVGGGDAALEAAVAAASAGASGVTLSYRGEAFSRVKPDNSAAIERAAAEGRVSVLFGTNVKEIRLGEAVLDRAGQEVVLKNDCVIVCAGGTLPTAFLKSIGVDVETKFGEA